LVHYFSDPYGLHLETKDASDTTLFEFGYSGDTAGSLDTIIDEYAREITIDGEMPTYITPPDEDPTKLTIENEILREITFFDGSGFEFRYDYYDGLLTREYELDNPEEPSGLYYYDGDGRLSDPSGWLQAEPVNEHVLEGGDGQIDVEWGTQNCHWEKIVMCEVDAWEDPPPPDDPDWRDWWEQGDTVWEGFAGYEESMTVDVYQIYPETKFVFGLFAGYEGHEELLWDTDVTFDPVPEHQDDDGDGLPDWWEYHYFGHLGRGPEHDDDDDGASNEVEYNLGTDPTEDDVLRPGIYYEYDALGRMKKIYRSPDFIPAP